MAKIDVNISNKDIEQALGKKIASEHRKLKSRVKYLETQNENLKSKMAELNYEHKDELEGYLKHKGFVRDVKDVFGQIIREDTV